MTYINSQNFIVIIQKINELLYKQLKYILKNDVLLYINASNIVKNNSKINELLLFIEPKTLGYIKKDEQKF